MVSRILTCHVFLNKMYRIRDTTSPTTTTYQVNNVTRTLRVKDLTDECDECEVAFKSGDYVYYCFGNVRLTRNSDEEFFDYIVCPECWAKSSTADLTEKQLKNFQFRCTRLIQDPSGYASD